MICKVWELQTAWWYRDGLFSLIYFNLILTVARNIIGYSQLDLTPNKKYCYCIWPHSKDNKLPSQCDSDEETSLRALPGCIVIWFYYRHLLLVCSLRPRLVIYFLYLYFSYSVLAEVEFGRHILTNKVIFHGWLLLI